MVIKSILGAICTCLAVISFNANAIPVLEPRLGGLAYYDPVADLTWLADADLANTTLYYFGQTWDHANAWAAGLNIAGVTGWRLPDTLQPDASCDVLFEGDSLGYDCTGSEMGNLFYNVLGGVARQPIYTTHNANYDLFSGIQSSLFWSATEYPNSDRAWYFLMDNGYQDYSFKDISLAAWAVHSGDVSTVPEPPMVLLITTGLFGFIWKTKN